MNELDCAVGALMCPPTPLSGEKGPPQLLGVLPTGRPQWLELPQIGSHLAKVMLTSRNSLPLVVGQGGYKGLAHLI